MSGTGKVYLIGAGCGEHDLITLRGMNILQSCDTVVFDSLIDEKLLDFCNENAELICVGKRAGKHSESQENINRILVQKALEGRTVARLKGGDPFVFGRGGEEITALKEYEIPYSIVPGVTSCVAAPELAGIPVTHRDLSRSFHVITGHTSENLLPENFELFAKLDGTLVFLMGLKNLRKIADGLITNGMAGDTPAAVISNGAKSCQRVIKERLDRIACTAEREQAQAPAVIVVGKTAALDFVPTLHRPLEGITVAAAGTVKTVNKLAASLEAYGARVNAVGKFYLKQAQDGSDFDRALKDISQYNWLVLTSPGGADIFLERLKKLHIDVRKLGQLKLAVIGTGTAEALEKAGIFPDLIPEKFNARSLGESLAKALCPDEKVLILRSSEGSAELTKPLDEIGIDYEDIPSYTPVYENLSEDEVSADFIAFASAGGVRGFFRSGGRISSGTKVVCIGEITANTVKEYGISDCKTAAVSCVRGMTKLILEEVECEDSED